MDSISLNRWPKELHSLLIDEVAGDGAFPSKGCGISYRLSVQGLKGLLFVNHYWNGLINLKLGELRQRKLTQLAEQYPVKGGDYKPLIFRVIECLSPGSQPHAEALRELLACDPQSVLQIATTRCAGVDIQATAAEFACLSSHVPQRAMRVLIAHTVRDGKPQELLANLNKHIADYEKLIFAIQRALPTMTFENVPTELAFKFHIYRNLDVMAERINHLAAARTSLLKRIPK
jgi:hypothetical protein